MPSNFWPRDPYFEWFDYWLKDQPSALIDEPAVFYSPRAWVEDRAGYRPGRLAACRALAAARRHRPSGSICAATAASAAIAEVVRPRSYRYDPRRPIPTLGGRNMLIDAGPRDQRPAQALPDYGLIYRGEPLDARSDDRRQCPRHPACPIRLPRHRLCRQADRGNARRARHAADGRGDPRDVPRPVAEPQPLTPGRVCRVTIDLGDIHHTFRAGSRIEVDVTSSNFPRRARNTNSGHPVLANDGEADIRVATNTVHHGPATPSFVELPVLGG